jgi:imidazolonepropionase-like amidohydrolase
MKRNKRIWPAHVVFVSICAVLAFTMLDAQPDELIYIKAKKIYTSDSGLVIANGGILIKEGKIIKVDKKTKPPKTARVIDFSDKIIIPGLIDAFTHMGFHKEDFNVRTEPTAPWRRPLEGIYRLYFGQAERKPPPPQIEARFKSSDAVFYGDPTFKKFLSEGITSAGMAIPTENLMGGMPFVGRLLVDSPTDFVMLDPAGMVFSFTGEKNVMRRYGDLIKAFLDALDYRKEWEKYKKDLKKYQDQEKKDKDKQKDKQKEKDEKGESVEKEVKEPEEPRKDENHEATLQVLDRKITALIRASKINEIQAALKIRDEFKIRLVLVGGHEAYKIPQEISTRKVSIIAGPEAVLIKKGRKVNYIQELLASDIPVAFCSHSSIDMSFLLYQLAYAVQHGLPRTEALDTVTAHAAQILGVADRVGSIAVGKEADFVVMDGEPFELRSRVRKVYMNGKEVFSDE